jgi:DNA-binding transcriptional MerR regulator
MSSEAECRYNIEELAERANVSRRTVRYYIQRGLIPPPLGLGRGKHYTEAHLACLIRIRELQEANVPLEEIASRLQGTAQLDGTAALQGTAQLDGTAALHGTARQQQVPAVPVQTTWTRVVLGEDIELHLRGRRLTEAQVEKLAVMVEELVERNEL